MAHPPAHPMAKATTGATVCASAPRIRILLIDDEAAVRGFLRLSLEPKGFAIDEAANGREGLAKAAASQYDVVILDLGLPDMDGLEALKRLREWSAVPVVVLTVRDAEDEKVALLENGADDYLTKPFGLPELVARLRVAHRRFKAPATPEDPVLRAGRLALDLVARKAELGGVALKLTATEFGVLKALVGGKGRVVTQKAILEAVWGASGADNSHYLRIYVGMLRKKIERDATHPELIITEPGVGYRLGLELGSA
jgi:two-component system KDP operon response regulator KdpE